MGLEVNAISLGLGLLFLAGTTGLFLVKDVYTKVGEIPALKERIKSLEVHTDDYKKTSEVVTRLEEQMKQITLKVDMMLSALLKDKSNV